MSLGDIQEGGVGCCYQELSVHIAAGCSAGLLDFIFNEFFGQFLKSCEILRPKD